MELKKKKSTLNEIESQIKAVENFSTGSEFLFVKNLTPRLFAADPTYKTNKAKLMRDVRLLRTFLDGKIPVVTSNDAEQLKILISKSKNSVGISDPASPVKTEDSHAIQCDKSRQASDTSSSSSSQDYNYRSKKRKKHRKHKKAKKRSQERSDSSSEDDRHIQVSFYMGIPNIMRVLSLKCLNSIPTVMATIFEMDNYLVYTITLMFFSHHGSCAPNGIASSSSSQCR